LKTAQNKSPAPTKLVDKLIRKFQQRVPVRTGSLLVTIFGDCIAPRGGVVWLGSLIDVLAPFGISHRLVRTAVYRLVQDKILENEQIGRRSYYSLTQAGRRAFVEATNRIYAESLRPWDGYWTLLVTSQLSTEEKAALKKDVEWLGFRALGSDLLAHPSADEELLQAHLQTRPSRHKLVIMKAQVPPISAATSLHTLVRETWSLPDIEAAYEEFLRLFHPVLNALQANKKLRGVDAFYLRTCLIHEYRRVLLRDTALPTELLPPTWKGHTAYQLTKELYQRTALPSEEFVDTAFQNQVGQLPPVNEQFKFRFGGLSD